MVIVYSFHIVIEKQALQYSLILFKNGVYSVNILNICRRTKFLKQKDYKKMKLPEGVVGFLLNSPTETVDDYSTVDQLYDWLSDALGGNF